MKLSLLEKYGLVIGFLLLLGFQWMLVDSGGNLDPAIAPLLPLNWIQMLTPEEPLGFYQGGGIILFIQLVIGTLAWLGVFFLVRGAYYFCTSLEGPSLWVAFALCLFLGFLFIVIVLIPAFQQMSVWWGNWPGVREAQLPGG